MQDDKVRINYSYRMQDKHVQDVCYFYTNNFSEWVKLFDYAQKNEIYFYPHDNAENLPKELYGIGATIEDFYVNFAGDEMIQTIDVILH